MFDGCHDAYWVEVYAGYVGRWDGRLGAREAAAEDEGRACCLVAAEGRAYGCATCRADVCMVVEPVGIGMRLEA